MNDETPTSDLVRRGIERGWIKPGPPPLTDVQVNTLANKKCLPGLVIKPRLSWRRMRARQKRLRQQAWQKHRVKPWTPPPGPPKDLSKDLRNL